MKVKVVYYAQFKAKAQKEEEVIETESTTIRELYQELQEQYQFELDVHEILVAVNDEYQSDLEYRLENRDSVVFLHPMSGG